MAAETVKSDAVKSGYMLETYAAGVPLVRSAKYTASSAMDANSVAQMLKLPDGARLMRMDMVFSAFGVGRTVDVGISTDIDKYFDGTDVSSAGTASVVLDEQLSADTTIQAKVLGDTWPEDGWLSLHVYYKIAENIEDEDIS